MRWRESPHIGMKRDIASRPDTSYYALRPFLSVKYLLNSKHSESFLDEEVGGPRMSGYNYVKTENEYYIYENENYVPYGFSYEYYMTKEFCDARSKNDRVAMMLKAIMLSEEQIEKYGHLLKNIEEDEDVDRYLEETTNLSCNYESMQFDCKKLAETSAVEFKFSNLGFKATVEREEENLVFFSVPYDEGWSATVNGKSVEIEKVNAGFMAVKVPKGTSEIDFRYKTPGLMLGIGITTISAVGFLIYVIFFALLNKSAVEDAPYFENVKLIEEWPIEENEALYEETHDVYEDDEILYEEDETLYEEKEELFEEILPQEPNRREETENIEDYSHIFKPTLRRGYENGFKINPDAFKDEEDDF